MRLFFVGIAVLLSGCSFRGMPYVEGNLTHLEAPTTAAVGQPIHLRAHATFAERYANPTLNVHVPLDGASNIAVEAVADWEAPPMGWGVLAKLPFAMEIDLEGRVTCDKPGTYVVTGEGLAPVTVVVGP